MGNNNSCFHNKLSKYPLGLVEALIFLSEFNLATSSLLKCRWTISGLTDSKLFDFIFSSHSRTLVVNFVYSLSAPQNVFVSFSCCRGLRLSFSSLLLVAVAAFSGSCLVCGRFLPIRCAQSMAVSGSVLRPVYILACGCWWKGWGKSWALQDP